jgi:hypothetical protein
LTSTCSEQFPLVLRIEVIHNFPVRGDTHISQSTHVRTAGFAPLREVRG